MSARPIDVAKVSAVLQALLQGGGKPVVIARGPVVPVMLSMMEAIAQAERPKMLLVNDLNHNWKVATERMRRTKQGAATLAAASGPSPVQRSIRP